MHSNRVVFGDQLTYWILEPNINGEGMALIDIDYVEGLKLLYKPNSVDPKALLLASSDGMERVNVMPFGSWSVSPAAPGGWTFSVYIVKSHYSYDLVEQTGQFTVNLPREGMEDAVKYCGSVSGRNHDKFTECGFTQVPSRYVAPPIIGECGVHIECKVKSKLPFWVTFPGENRKDIEMPLFVAQIASIYADADIA